MVQSEITNLLTFFYAREHNNHTPFMFMTLPGHDGGTIPVTYKDNIVALKQRLEQAVTSKAAKEHTVPSLKHKAALKKETTRPSKAKASSKVAMIAAAPVPTAPKLKNKGLGRRQDNTCKGRP